MCNISYSVSDAEGQMKVTEVATRPLVQDLLNHDVSLEHLQVFKDQCDRSNSFIRQTKGFYSECLYNK